MTNKSFLNGRYQARCKSGYTFNGNPCQRMSSRGSLLCADCHSAVVVDTVMAHSWVSLVRYWFDIAVSFNPFASQHSVAE